MQFAKHQINPDGRKARSERTRAAIVDALMSLVEDGHLQPTSEDVALQAGVGHRTVFRHFQDMDRLYEEIDRRLDASVFSNVMPIEPDGPLRLRIEKLVTVRSGAYEKIKMFRRTTSIRYWSSPFLQKNRARYVKFLRGRLLHTVPEYKSCSAGVQSAVELLLSFEGWEQLRVDQRRSVRAARAHLVEAITQLLG